MKVTDVKQERQNIVRHFQALDAAFSEPQTWYFKDKYHELLLYFFDARAFDADVSFFPAIQHLYVK